MRVVFVLRCDHGMTFASWRTRAACMLSFARRTVARGEAGCIDANANKSAPQFRRLQQLWCLSNKEPLGKRKRRRRQRLFDRRVEA